MKTTIIALMLFFLGNSLIFAQKTEDRKLSSFTDITLRIGATVHLTQGNEQSVQIKAEQNVLDKLITEVKDRKLVIRFKTESMFSNWSHGKIDIFITTPEIDKLMVIGSGSIIGENEIDSRILDITVSGSGEVNLSNLKADKVSSVVSGSGSFVLAGNQTASEFKSILSGSGSVKASKFSANDVDVKIGGSGNCWITAKKNLKARIAGSGNVYYSGNPALDTSITGSGQVKADSLK